MKFNEDELHHLIHVVDKGQEKLEDLQDQRDRLLEANRRLVELVKKLEIALEESEGGEVKFEDNVYSFDDGWMPTEIIHDKNLELSSDIDFEEIDGQVAEVIKSMKRIQKLKTEN